MKINPTTRKIITRIIFWVVYSYILYVAIIDGWWLWVAIASPILFYIFYYEDLPESLKLEVLKIREMIYPLKDELRKIRLQIRQDVNELFQATMLLNLVCGPAFTAVILVILRGFRRRSQKVREF